MVFGDAVFSSTNDRNMNWDNCYACLDEKNSMLAEVIEGTFVDTSGIRSQSPTKEDCPSPRSEEVSVGGIISEA